MAPHLYIHVPFCISKCHYCAFYSKTGVEKSVVAKYPTLLQKELMLRRRGLSGLKPRTIYMGGGTPSLLGADGCRQLTELLKETIQFDQLEEWSVEINPATATAELFETMLKCGVNRLTFGAQSFDDGVLYSINRAHTAQCTTECIKLARSCGFDNTGIDLIAGLPCTDREIWRKDLETALSINPRHLSIYALSLEPETKLKEMVDNGLAVADIDEQFDRLHEAEEILTKSGFMRYEISNYALPGYECRHNLGIWRGEDYLGIGPAAASRIDLKRLENKPNFNQWMNNLSKNELPPHTCEELTPEDDALQRVIFRIRLQEGFNPEQSIKTYTTLTKHRKSWQKTLGKLQANGALEQKNYTWTLTERGLEVCDYVIRELM